MALETATDILALAKALTRSADAFHGRLLKEISAGRLDREAARRAFEEEAVLRQQAEALCIDAAERTVQGVQTTQADLLAAVAGAQTRIAQEEHIAHAVDRLAALLALAAAVGSGQAPLIATALLKVAQEADGS
ncbi:MAG TPA: hypothetical protein VN436_06980 [Holophaga sp.]|nr:hypothetical protein [Holophaga sp.]